ncbi:hypothetical protein E3A20_12200 [Planctomyces bekefii]|uniref:Uncharacterized protein n=1 Tax=Planctomyces bekefii TaxID=1653850 RepID=A0A5C6M695_9PLAN|nr:hypothetical protein E3A20_12200 [Planctomyces bekefii]
MKPCVNREGERGVEENSPWLAMGFPCTGANGRIEIKGTYNSPKMISFVLGTDCGMNPDSAVSVERMVREKLDLPENSRLLAFTPFVVQYWEVPGFTDADIGFAIELRSSAAIDGNWKRFTGNQPLHVKLYGRENTWVQGGFFYAAEGDLRITGRNTFQMKLTSVKKLSPEEIDEVKGRCDQLKPKRNCSDVFP